MPARVLVLDDSSMTGEVLVNALRGANIEADAAVDLATLNEKLSQNKFDLILVDVNMPEAYGDDVVEFLRQQKNLAGKLVLYSDLPEDELDKKAKAVSADGFLPKSRGVEATVQEVAKMLEPPKPAAKAAEGAPRKKRVLIVDDSEMVMKLLEAELSAKGFDVSTADTADKATKIILKKQTRPDMILLDVRMPNVNGEQFCRFIKSNALFKGIKVLLCSGEDIEELQRICREAGADGYVPKDAVLSKVLEST
jgi:CheY-like chemotaxis protein